MTTLSRYSRGPHAIRWLWRARRNPECESIVVYDEPTAALAWAELRRVDRRGFYRMALDGVRPEMSVNVTPCSVCES